jgi:hypothetical protein
MRELVQLVGWLALIVGAAAGALMLVVVRPENILINPKC